MVTMPAVTMAELQRQLAAATPTRNNAEGPDEDDEEDEDDLDEEHDEEDEDDLDDDIDEDIENDEGGAEHDVVTLDVPDELLTPTRHEQLLAATTAFLDARPPTDLLAVILRLVTQEPEDQSWSPLTWDHALAPHEDTVAALKPEPRAAFDAVLAIVGYRWGTPAERLAARREAQSASW